MWSYRFEIALRQDLLLYYSTTNSCLCVISIQQALYQETVNCNYLIPCYILYAGSYSENQGNNKTKNDNFEAKKSLHFGLSLKKDSTLNFHYVSIEHLKFSYNEHLEMLIVLHIRLFLMSCGTGVMSLGDSEINYDFF